MRPSVLDSPLPYPLPLFLPELRRLKDGFGGAPLAEGVDEAIDCEVSGSRMALTIARNVDDEGIERRKPQCSTSVMESLHECGNQVRAHARTT